MAWHLAKGADELGGSMSGGRGRDRGERHDRGGSGGEGIRAGSRGGVQRGAGSLGARQSGMRGPRGHGRGGPEPGAPHLAGNWPLAVAALIFGAFMVFLDTSIVNIAIPTLETTFGVGTRQIEWVVTVYLLALGVSSPAGGWVADRVGYKRLYLLGIAVFSFGSLLAALSPTLGVMIGARIIQAVGGGMVPAATTALLFQIVPREKLGVANGFRGIAMLLGPAMGPVLGGYLVQYVDWRWIFTINIPVGIAGILIGTMFIPDIPSRKGSRFDRWGFVTAAVGLGCLLFALSEGQSYGWGSFSIVALFYVAACMLIAFVWVELREPDPMLDLRVFKLTSYSAAIAFTVIAGVSLMAGVFFLPIFLQLVRGEGALQAGLVLLPGAAASGLVMPIAGRLYDRIDAKPLVLTGTAILTLATWLFHSVSLTTPDSTIAAWAALRGVGMGLAMMPAITAGISVVPNVGLSRAAAMRNVIQRASGSFGITVLTVLLDAGIATTAAHLSSQVTASSPIARVVAARGTAALVMIHGRIQAVAFAHSLDHVFGVMAGIAALGFIPALFLRGDRGQGAQQAQRRRPAVREPAEAAGE